MELDLLFSIAGFVVLPGWLALLAAPQRFSLVRPLVVAIAVALGMLYTALIGAFWAGADGGFDSLDAVAALFAHPGLLLAGWVHYLAFDLLVGLWEREEAIRLGLSRWLLAPCLVLTFLFGPIGWLLFMGLRYLQLQRARRDSAAAQGAA